MQAKFCTWVGGGDTLEQKQAKWMRLYSLPTKVKLLALVFSFFKVKYCTRNHLFKVW